MYRVVAVVVIAGSFGTRARGEPLLGFEPIDTLDLPFDHAEVRLTALATSPDTFGAGRYRDESVTLAGAIPLHSSASWRLLAQIRLGGELVQATLPRDQSITEDAVGLTALYFSSRRDLYALYAGAAIAETPDTISHPTVMPTVLGLGTYRSGDVTWIYGGGLGNALGRTWLLPAAGLSWRASRSWTLAVLLPVETDASLEVTGDLALSLVLAVSGDRYDIANDAAFPGAADILRVQLAALRAALRARYQLGSRWSLRAELGALAPRRLQIVDGNTVEMSTTSAGTVYVSVGVSYAFGS